MFLYSSISTLMMISPRTGLALAYVPIRYVEDSDSLNGSYTNLGSHRGSFSGRNSGAVHCLFMHLEVMEDLRSACANTSRLQGYVGGTLISVNASNNPAYGNISALLYLQVLPIR